MCVALVGQSHGPAGWLGCLAGHADVTSQVASASQFDQVTSVEVANAIRRNLVTSVEVVSAIQCAQVEQIEAVRVTRPFFWPCVCTAVTLRAAACALNDAFHARCALVQVIRCLLQAQT